MKHIYCYVLLFVWSATSIIYAADVPVARTGANQLSIILRIPGVDVDRYVPENVMAVENALNPEVKKISSDRKHVQGIIAEGKQLTMTSQTWDTTHHVWVTSYTLVNAYDGNGNITESVQQYRYPIDSPLVNSGRVTYSYDGNNNATEVFSYSWVNNAWRLNSRFVQTFDGSHRLLTAITYRRVADAWVESYQQLNTYGAGPYATETIGQNYVSGAWVNSTRNTYTFTDWNDYLVSISYRWVSGAWGATYRTTNTYDANHHQTHTLSELYSVSVWANSSQTTNVFDGNGNNTESVYQNWDGSAWVNNGRSISTYDAQHGILVGTYSNWVTDSWVPDSRTSYTYDGSHRASVLLSESYIGGVWVGSYKWDYTFDAAGNIASYTGQRYLNGAWAYDSRVLMTWYGVAAGVSDSPALAAGFKLNANYPNPFNPTTKISYNVGKAGLVSLTVFDMLGREVATLVNEQQSAGTYTINWNAGTAASGLYYYRLTAGGFTLTNSMMLVK